MNLNLHVYVQANDVLERSNARVSQAHLDNVLLNQTAVFQT